MHRAAVAKTRIFWAGSDPGHHFRGVTLIELLVVLVLMSALLALVPPLFDRGLSSTEINAAAREMMAAMRYARSTAVSRRQPIAFTLDLEQHHFHVDGRRPVTLPRALQLELVTAESELQGRGAGSITFFADGSATGGSLTLVAEARQIRLDVDWLSGRVTLNDE